MTGDSRMFQLVKTLTELPGPIGHEDAVQDWLVDAWQPLATTVERTRVNNVIAHVGGTGPRLLIQAHADEICLMVKSVSDDGFIHIAIWNADRAGRPPRWFFPIGQPARILGTKGDVDGLFATASGHVASDEQAERGHFSWNDWFIDVGVTSAAEVRELGSRPGCRAVWNPPTQRMRGGSRIYGKAMDDRGGLAIITALLERVAKADLQYDLSVASTVQEETGLIGASSLADHADYDLAIALDVGLCGDVPGVDRLDVTPALGHGPIVVYKDSGVHYSRRLSDQLMALAESNDIPVQPAIFRRFASDGEALIRRGVDTALVAFPTRYTHSPFEMVEEGDLDATVALFAAFVTSPPAASQ
ncbi:MAG: M20/M25/M40 family metallo-hydrolase [Ilumatobacter sp.]